MSDLYGKYTAYHYAAYRPALHEVILAECLDSENFSLGLDIGCGTGRSSLPLAKYCDRVIALDPSAEMISQAHQHPKITYKHMQENLDIPHEAYDIITFAGSLFYCKSQALLDKITSCCTSPAVILVYDFQLHLDRILQELGLDIPEEVSEYDHDADFSGLNIDLLREVFHEKRPISYPLAVSDLAHFLLSHESIYRACDYLAEKKPIHAYLTGKLTNLPKNKIMALQTDLYYKKYQVKKD